MGTASEGQASSGGRILVVDDTPANLAALEIVLAPLGCATDAAASGVEALRRAAEREFDLILLDLRMPVMDGWETAHRLRQQGCRAPILFMTAFDGTPADAERLATLSPADRAPSLSRPELLRASAGGWLSLQRSVRTWKTLARELALENDRLKAKPQGAS